jgi:hypothetical protein
MGTLVFIHFLLILLLFSLLMMLVRAIMALEGLIMSMFVTFAIHIQLDPASHEQDVQCHRGTLV